MKSKILQSPLDVGWLRRCISCKRAFAMQEVSREKRGSVTVVKYQCQYCKHEVEHGDRLSRGVV